VNYPCKEAVKIKNKKVFKMKTDFTPMHHAITKIFFSPLGNTRNKERRHNTRD